ncbi:MAG TPA: NAD(+) diphosphatase [Pseudomonadales bacterium]|nr:NAD(+) diphosphatase [Pseudomonadales bacterium]
MELKPGFTGATLDRADALRTNDERLAAARADPRARLLGLNGLEPLTGGDGRLLWRPMHEAAAGNELVLLGLDGGEPRFAELRVEEADSVNRSMAVMQALARLDAADAALYGGARSVIDWHYRHLFCARCGAATALFRAGWGRKCARCNTEHFPRVDPVVIMLAEFGGRVLLGRQPMFPPKFFSALAGFVEPGESLEEAVRRELLEEAGIRTGAVRYVVSQPWPFPSSLMIGCVAEALDEAITLDTTELQDAMWVGRAAVEAALAGEAEAPFVPPPPVALAHSLLRAWLAS